MFGLETLQQAPSTEAASESTARAAMLSHPAIDRESGTVYGALAKRWRLHAGNVAAMGERVAALA